MKSLLVLFPLTILYLAVKSTLFAGVPVPEVTVLVVFYVAYTRNTLEGVFTAFILGYIEDIFNGGIIGSSSFALVLVFMGVFLASRRMHFNTPAIRAAGAGAASLFKGLVIYAVIDHSEATLTAVAAIFFQALITAIFAPAVLVAFAWITALVTPRAFEDEVE
jgi:rod shape-determining protein MreD